MSHTINLNDFLTAQIQRQKKKEPSLIEGLNTVADGIIHNIRKARVEVEREERGMRMELDSLNDRKASEERVADALKKQTSQLKSDHVELQTKYDSLSSIDKEPEVQANRQKYFDEASKALSYIDQEQKEHRRRSQIVSLCASRGVIVLRGDGSYTLCLRDRPDLKSVVVKAQENSADDVVVIDDAVKALHASAAQTPRPERVRRSIYDATRISAPNTSVVLTALEDEEKGEEMDDSQASIQPEDTTNVAQEDDDTNDNSESMEIGRRQTALAGIVDYDDTTESTFMSDC